MAKYNWDQDSRWEHWEDIVSIPYTCWSCGENVASTGGRLGFGDSDSAGHMAVVHCSRCDMPNIIICDSNWNNARSIIPAPNANQKVKNLPENVKQAYDEACICLSCNALTATMMMCRKLLKCVAIDVDEEANKGRRTWMHYVAFFHDNGYLSPIAYKRLNIVRIVGNEANHDLKPISRQEAEALLSLITTLLVSIYEFPSRPAPKKQNEIKKLSKPGT